MCTCPLTPACVPDGGQKIDPLKLELQVVVRPQGGHGEWNSNLCKNSTLFDLNHLSSSSL